MSYAWSKCRASELKFVPVAGELFTDDEVWSFAPQGIAPDDRIGLDGFITITGRVGNREVALIYNDFRVNGAGFGIETSRRVQAFLQTITARALPLVFVLNTIGVRMMDGRSVFQDAFGVIPALSAHAQTAPIFTVSLGKALGIGAVFLRIGHYRAGIAKESLINLTGPEVIKLFFGKLFDFASIAGATKQFKRSTLMNELVFSREDSMSRIQSIILLSQGIAPNEFHGKPAERLGEQPEREVLSILNGSEVKLRRLLNSFDGPALEVFAQLNPVVRTFLVRHRGAVFGLFVNPPGHANNMVSAATLRRYREALDLFAALKLPIVSLLDTPGVDPRGAADEDSDIVTSLVRTSEKIIGYPYPKMGVVYGRGFGGACVLGFPKIFGAQEGYVVRGAQMGVMHPSIIEQLLSGTPRLMEKWRQSSERETPDFQDMISSGVLDGTVEVSEVPAIIERFIERHKSRLSYSVQYANQESLQRILHRWHRNL